MLAAAATHGIDRVNWAITHMRPFGTLAKQMDDVAQQAHQKSRLWLAAITSDLACIFIRATTSLRTVPCFMN